MSARTPSGSQRALTAKAQHELANVTGRYTYIDTTQILVPSILNKPNREHLRRLNARGEVRLGRSKRIGWHYIRLHRPSQQALDFLANLFPRHTVSRVDVAVDLTASSAAEARRVHTFLQLHLTQLWHGKRR